MAFSWDHAPGAELINLLKKRGKRMKKRFTYRWEEYHKTSVVADIPDDVTGEELEAIHEKIFFDDIVGGENGHDGGCFDSNEPADITLVRNADEDDGFSIEDASEGLEGK
jgi:hypothetical protein